MRIDLHPQPQPVAEPDRTAAQNTAPSGSANSTLAPDHAQLSTSHAQVQALAAQVLQLPKLRQQRIVALRQTVQNGSYRPQAEHVAQAIFGHMVFDSAA